MNQKTIKNTTTFSGIGLHSGIEINVKILPADIDSGINFIRTDLNPKVIIQADLKSVIDTKRATTIGKGEHKVATIEHLMSAFYGLGINNATVELDGPEIPILNGSASTFCDKILEAKIDIQDKEKESLTIENPIEFFDEISGAKYTVIPYEGTEYLTMIDFKSSRLKKQYAQFNQMDDYQSEISKSRTFVFIKDLVSLYDQGLIKGGNLENAIIIAEEGESKTNLKIIGQKLGFTDSEVNKIGIINNEELIFHNEPARHKLLDLIGDLALLGVNIKGKIIAEKPGHTGNIAFAKYLKSLLQIQRKLKNKPIYDVNVKPIKELTEISAMLPHRYPFLLVDKVIKLTPNEVVGIKNVTFNEQIFQGHFPGNPVFPGVLQMEALAQTGGVLALSNVDEPEKYDTYFLKLDKVKFKHKVTPGDTLILKMELISPIRRGIVHMQGTVYVGDKIVSEGELVAQIVKSR